MADDRDAPRASRPPPPEVAPVLHGGVRYEQDLQSGRHGGTQPGGYLVAIDPATGARLWMLRVYEVALQEAHGVTTPGRYFRRMAMVPGRDELEIEDESGARWRVDLAARRATRLTSA